MHGFYASRIETQIDRNRFLKSENTKLDKEIAEIQKLKDEIQALLARKQVIETLQTDRATTVYMLEQLVRQMPEGVYLKSVVQKGTARQSARLRAIERAGLDPDAQHRGLALARQSGAGRGQGERRRQAAGFGIQHEPEPEAPGPGEGRGEARGAGEGRGEERLSHGDQFQRDHR